MKNNISEYLRNKILNFILKKIGIKKDISLIYTIINIIDVGNIATSLSLTIGINKYWLLLIYFLFFV